MVTLTCHVTVVTLLDMSRDRGDSDMSCDHGDTMLQCGGGGGGQGAEEEGWREHQVEPGHGVHRAALC